MAVVKGDAYGHGLTECARALVQAGARNLGVLDAHEGLILRKTLPEPADIYVLAGLQTREQIKAALDNRLIPVIYSLPQMQLVENIIQAGRPTEAYLKIDTGMGRLGLPWFEIQTVLPALLRKTKIHFRGLMTHLATAGDADARIQLDRFQRAADLDRKLGLTGGRHSALAGPGLLAYPEYNDHLSRAGLLLYGGNPLENEPERLSEAGRRTVKKLKPVMSLVSQIIQVRTVRAGETISYDRTFTAPRDMRIAAVPLGYVHGLARSRSGQGCALTGGRPAPLLGRVCMNLSLYDVTQTEAQAGQEIVLLGRDGRKQITPAQAAQWQGTSAYEIFCLFGRLNSRIYTDGAD
jgi:alanine racemase